jgi:type IV fimbrial biogenesis protein FimT
MGKQRHVLGLEKGWIMLTLPMRRARKPNGFTLIELAVVLAVLVIAVMIGVPSFQEAVRNAKVRTVAESIKSGLQVARLEAIKSNTPVIFSLDNDSSALWQIIDARTGTTLQQSAESFNQVTISPDVGSEFACNGLGRQWSTSITGFVKSPPDPPFTQIDVEVSAGQSLRVTTSTGGQIRLCDPTERLPAGDPRKC